MCLRTHDTHKGRQNRIHSCAKALHVPTSTQSGAPETCPAAYIIPLDHLHLVLHEPFEPFMNALDFVALRDAQTREAPEGRVHTARRRPHIDNADIHVVLCNQ